MKIVQSYWSKPISTNDIDIHGRSHGGWIEHKYHLMSWALSCLQLKKYYNKVILYTDKVGKKLLIDDLKLPYDDVFITMDDIDSYSHKLWAIGKILTYSMQNEPFLHVDGDVFIWEKFSYELEESNLVIQNNEIDFPYYGLIIEEIEKCFTYIPESIVQSRNKSKTIKVANAGIIGGTDIDFFHQYTAEAFKFVSENMASLELINLGLFNTIYEQYLFSCLADQQKIEPYCLFDNIESDFFDLVNFKNVPEQCKYIHVVGTHKGYLANCRHLENLLKKYHADWFNLIDKLCE